MLKVSVTIKSQNRWIFHCTVHRDALARPYQRQSHLRRSEIRSAIPCGNVLLGLQQALTAHRYTTDERKGHEAASVNPDCSVQVRHLENGDLESVLRSDRIIRCVIWKVGGISATESSAETQSLASLWLALPSFGNLPSRPQMRRRSLAMVRFGEDAIVDLAEEGAAADGAMGLASRGSFRLGEDRSFEHPINAADTAMSANNLPKRGPCHMC